MEILIHNISHADFIVELTTTHNDSALTTLARPKFSLFQQTSDLVLQTLLEHRPSVGKTKCDTGCCPCYAHCQATEYPIGFRFEKCKIPVPELSHFRIKNASGFLETKSPVYISTIYFPLLAMLIPKWNTVLQEHESTKCDQYLYLISGAGIPRNTKHSPSGNSTQITALLMLEFIRMYYPKIQAHQIHSGSNIFRYDDNVSFVNQELRPQLEDRRQQVVDKCGEHWQQHYHITIAYADGTPARLSALNASLRVFRPSYLHVWQLKTFWHEFKLSLDDVDFHSFENIEASPALPRSEIRDRNIQVLTTQMKEFRDAFTQALMNEENELGSFWLRKSRRPVLSILVVQKTSQSPPQVYRGMNSEVSMPTGSLCAERNAIGSAVAADPTLLRSQMKMIGVLSVYMPPGVGEMLSPIERTRGSPEARGRPALPLASTKEVISPAQSHKKEGTRRKRPRTFSCDSTLLEKSVVSTTDKNPLSPCGSCKEWLLKIAEANPSFKVITFSDRSCDELYINQYL